MYNLQESSTIVSEHLLKEHLIAKEKTLVEQFNKCLGMFVVVKIVVTVLDLLVWLVSVMVQRTMIKNLA